MSIDIIDFRNPEVSSDGSYIDLEILTSNEGWMPTTFRLNNIAPHQQVILDKLNVSELAVKERNFNTEKMAVKDWVKNIRSKALDNPNSFVTTEDGRRWQTNAASIADINDTITLSSAMGAMPAGIEWRDLDNVRHPATAALLLEIGVLAAQRRSDVWKSSWNELEQIDAMTTIEQLDAYTPPSVL